MFGLMLVPELNIDKILTHWSLVTYVCLSKSLAEAIKSCKPRRTTLQWRHNGHDSVSNHQPHDCLLNRLFRHRSKKTSKLRVTGLCVGNSPAQMASNKENVSIWWRHHERREFCKWWCIVNWTHWGRSQSKHSFFCEDAFENVYSGLSWVEDCWRVGVRALAQPVMIDLLILRSKQKGSHFANDIFTWIFLNENVWILINISLKSVLKGQIDNYTTLV